MQTFKTPAPITAVLDIPASNVRITAADRLDTTVEIRPANADKSRDVKAAEQAEVTFADGVLRIDAPAAKSQFFGLSGSIEVSIELPTGSRVDANVSCAGFQTLGRLGDVTVEGANDTIKIDEAASLRLTAHSGDIAVGSLGGSAEISTQQGDIHVSRAAAGKVVLRTQQGDLSIDAAPGVSASLDAGTGQGRIHNSLRNADGVAGLTIHASTQQGNITARSL
ncbi:DUF4097 family beta strand repeat-containing protein [Streptomyces sp. SID3343]|uniref:DUF4097 family beta strand repeat-containing protein n=1 Tax=Streptomyces sp. SID3343 TaxID=2690260 RepID=UPI00136A3471|nr:DUF4097 family beta strand repeat-containing protein [Streptomyces sp. SID3343]MYW05796.1 DUF4097 family beta strand repeat protein [Streptomyces sp. SID3343]